MKQKNEQNILKEQISQNKNNLNMETLMEVQEINNESEEDSIRGEETPKNVNVEKPNVLNLKAKNLHSKN